MDDRTLLRGISLAAALTVVFVIGVNAYDFTYKYPVTGRGLITPGIALCEVGLLLNREGDNILDEEGEPVTCSGYVRLTAAEAAEWVAK